MSYILKIFKENKGPLLLIYLYIFLAQALFLGEPYILGKTIDGLLIHNYNWLLIFLALELTGNLFMYKRMVYDVKVFGKIYNKIIIKYLIHHKESDSSSKIARTEMTNNVINFFEHDIHYYIMAIMSMIGSLFFIFLQDFQTGIIVALCVFPILIVIKLLYKKIAQATRLGNDQYENKAAILNENEESKIRTYYNRRQKILVSASTIQGKNWFSMNFIKTVFLVLSLIVFTNNRIHLTQGQAVAMYQYINQFLISLMSLPIAMETYSRIRDVIKRIKIPIEE